MDKLGPRFFLGLSLGFLTLIGTTSCHRDPNFANASSAPDNSGPDPADSNLAPVPNNQPLSAAAPVPASKSAVLGIRAQAQPQQSAEQYPPQQYPPQQTALPDQDQAFQDAQAAEQLDQEGETPPVEYADQPPPPLPVYEQPEAPAPNYIWTPGYWYWAPAGYYWIPGAWCAPPYYGALWTPGYWGWYHNRWGFHRGYWGPHIGFYGGINYGFGYTGIGYYGGYWRGNNFYYNRAVNRVNVNITNVYNRTVVVNNNTRIAYNGGRGGIVDRPRPAEIEAMRGPRIPPMSTQIQRQQEAQQNRQQFYNVNKGRPALVAAPRPIAAQPGLTRPNLANRPGQPETRPVQSGFRPGEPNNRPQIQPTRPSQPEVRPGQTELRPGQPQTRPVQSDSRPNQPQVRPDNHLAQPEARPVQPQQPQGHPVQPETRSVQPAQPQSRPEFRPEQPQNRAAQPQYRPAPQPVPQSRPQPMERPVPQPRPTQQPEFRPAPQPQSRPAPQPQSRPAPQQQQSRPEGRPQSQNNHSRR
jgi:WXXGXW repeat (2 copies)